MRSAFLQVFDAGFDDGLGSIEVRFPDFQMDDAATLPLQFRRSAEHFESGFASYRLHPLRYPAFDIQLQSVDSLANKMTREYNILSPLGAGNRL